MSAYEGRHRMTFHYAMTHGAKVAEVRPRGARVPGAGIRTNEAGTEAFGPAGPGTRLYPHGRPQANP